MLLAGVKQQLKERSIVLTVENVLMKYRTRRVSPLSAGGGERVAEGRVRGRDA
jgi:hypothetical protein